ncbi:MAG: class II fumarate hydratase [Oscillospiraceae bacterium]|jgi:fumarate hydratase class II|nr:class II fumarate hydratase [Oscillospiraceae bacterium]
MPEHTPDCRREEDTMGTVYVPADRLWGAQTQRSLQNFAIGEERMPAEIIRAFAVLKKAAALANRSCGRLDEDRCGRIAAACDEILTGARDGEFPLRVWQTGSGTQSNMNVNEVIAHLCAAAGVQVHPNDHVNMSQSSNDTFPTALHIAAVCALEGRVLPALEALGRTLERLEEENRDVIKIGRTHLQDAVPLRFSQEISGWRAMAEACHGYIRSSLEPLRDLALGGTAVGTGLNCPPGFAQQSAELISQLTGRRFRTAPNKFHALSSRDGLVHAHGALKALAADLMKIANDVRWLASGPRCGLGEITIPENEPGSSIMPGKVNPTQCEAVTMAAVQVMGNDAAIGFAASQGNFELNVFMPVIAYNFLQSARLLADVMDSFRVHCLEGLRADREAMAAYLRRSLMLVTCLTPGIGYERAAQAARLAHREGITLKEAVLQCGFLTEKAYEEAVDPEKMV